MNRTPHEHRTHRHGRYRRALGAGLLGAGLLAVSGLAHAATGRVQGQALDTRGRPLPGVQVWIKPVVTTGVAEVITDEQGRYERPSATAPPPGCRCRTGARPSVTAWRRGAPGTIPPSYPPAT